ncbi:hypothetical protein C8R41DRAFT_926212 [Lentinula lateritia]|uniref:Uncharacterized protein n=1 Tax=Lentinula lateritia TaxID=40482 RepID=A0ABQ8V031_9AGAR|nr:hypothetical protein C8R41DRAFT_926212 [Lentinula lateritia]
MGSGGMSEDEDGVDKVVIDDRELEEAVKITMFLPFRHSKLTTIVAVVDKVSRVEKQYFVQSGRTSKRRVRGDSRCKKSDRKPPIGWPMSFFADGYLESLPEYRREKLRLSEKIFPLYDLEKIPEQYL